MLVKILQKNLNYHLVFKLFVLDFNLTRYGTLC